MSHRKGSGLTADRQMVALQIGEITGSLSRDIDVKLPHPTKRGPSALFSSSFRQDYSEIANFSFGIL
jgi:hypothetical protein